MGIPGILHSVSCSTDCLRPGAGYGRGAAGFCLQDDRFWRDGSLVAGGDAAVAEGVSAEELRGNENGYRWSDVWKNFRDTEKNRSFGPESIFLSDWIFPLY